MPGLNQTATAEVFGVDMLNKVKEIHPPSAAPIRRLLPCLRASRRAKAGGEVRLTPYIMKPVLPPALLRLAVAVALIVSTHGAAPTALIVDVDRPGAPVSPTMWGVFFEDINGGADGGLYAELVKNRSFDFTDPLMGWHRLIEGDASGTLTVTNAQPRSAANPRYLSLVASCGGFGVANEGFAGIGVKAGESYRFSVLARAPESSVVCGCGKSHWSLRPPPVRVELVSTTGVVLAHARLKGLAPAWKEHTATLRPKATDARAQLRLVLEQGGEVHFDMISLFPAKTWKNRPGGLRADLVQMLADLKPGFVRFPGGCIVEGRYLSTRYQWKTTLGPVEERKLIINRWNDEFKHRPAPDYFQTFGLGFFEYFQMCEDIGAEPLPILNCGMACQFNSNELVPLDQLEPYVQDALDLIEFANGPVTSTWGAKRAGMGHPKPFHLKLLGVGNEQWGPPYIERYTVFAKALKAKHPEVALVASAGPAPEDERFHHLWPKLRELNADIIDEHCYATPDWFLDNSARYDRYDRTGPKVFMGEYAAQSVKTVSPDNRNNWECALAEAAYLTGLERNGDVVTLSSYAPLFGHEDRWQWRPNLIWMDNLRVYGTPSYYVQQLFSRNRGDHLLPVRLEGPVPRVNGKPRLYASAVFDDRTREVVLKVVNATPEPRVVNLHLAGVATVRGEARATVLTAASLQDENDLAEPRRVAPTESRWKVSGPQGDHTFPSQSLTVLRFATRGRK